MSDLIKRKDAIKAMEQRYEDILRIFKRKVKVGEKAIALDMIGCIKMLPSADRPSGEWIPMTVSSGRDSWKCSVCGRRARGKIKNLPYCHCGARMKGADDE